MPLFASNGRLSKNPHHKDHRPPEIGSQNRNGVKLDSGF